ncbi:MAG: periplasmic heavy metal sensor [Phycisphaerae bacterium]|jgi:Spy/CpxP family protein refolding chaperone
MAWLASKWHVLVLIGSLAFNAGVGTTYGVRAFHRHAGEFGPHGGGRQRHRAILEEMGLRPEQIAKVEAEGEKLHAEMRKLHEAFATESAALADLLMADEPDRDAIAAQLDKLAEMHRTKQSVVVEHVLRFSELLDDDQRDAFEGSVRGIITRCGMGPPGSGKHHRGKGRFGPRGGGRHRRHGG